MYFLVCVKTTNEKVYMSILVLENFRLEINFDLRNEGTYIHI